MEKKELKIDSSLLWKLLRNSPKRKITDSTFTRYLRKSRVGQLNRTQKSGFTHNNSMNKSSSPLFVDSIKVQKIKLITHKEAIIQNHSKRDLVSLTERYNSIKTCNASTNNIKGIFTGATGRQKSSFRKEGQHVLKLKYLNIPKISKNMQKITIKEACKDGEWNLKARPEIEKFWRCIINKSNGFEFASSGTYKVFIGKGNNSRLIKKLFAARPCWTLTDTLKEADFIWTQWKNNEIISSLPSGQSIHSKIKPTVLSLPLFPINIRGENNFFKMLTIEELNFHLIRNSSSYVHVEIDPKPTSCKLYNKLENNEHLTDKKGLFHTMLSYYTSQNQDPFEYMPITFHIKSDQDSIFSTFQDYFFSLESKKPQIQNLWIMKPAEKSNRGQGITICNTLSQIQSILNSQKDVNRSYILQKYIERPFLIHKRKFDFRCFALITSVNSVIQGYFYTEGYIRTASSEFSTKDISDNFKHLTNDAIQKHGEDYGKYEDGNKMSYREFQRYLDNHYHVKKVVFAQEILPKIKEMVKDTIKASFFKLDPCKRINCMEILGYDFMLDSNLKPWLIEVNTNPCLETTSSILSVLIPAMVENSFKIIVDSLFPPAYQRASDGFIENKYELIFHELTDGKGQKTSEENGLLDNL